MAADVSSIPLFASLAEPDREKLEEACSQVEVEAGTMLVHEGDFGFAMYAIVSGSADVSQDGALVRTLGPGDVFGEVAVLSSGRRTASVTATTPMTLVVVLNRDVWQLERDHPEAGVALRKTIADCLESRSSA